VCERSSHVIAACDYYEDGTAGHNPAAQARAPGFEAAVSELLEYASDEKTYDECDTLYGDFYVRIYE